MVQVIGASTEVYGIIGWPVRHSLSPVMHNAALAAAGRDAVYLAFEVPPERLKRAIKGAEGLGVRGLNLTIPHKEAALSMCHRLSGDALKVGAVNTLTFEQGAVNGHNTDAPGFLKALAGPLGCDPRGARALVLGAGGVARAVIAALAGQGAGAIAIAARTPGRAEVLLQQLCGGAGTIVPWEPAAVATALAGADLVISCLPPGATPPSLEALPARAVVLDVTYGRDTALLATARRVGACAADGREMLVQQGALAFELWTGQPAPVDAMRAAIRAALREESPAP
ncbi:MAG TPA: shikimate dehydrogenase [Polyangia bacterium]